MNETFFKILDRVITFSLIALTVLAIVVVMTIAAPYTFDSDVPIWIEVLYEGQNR